MKTQPSNILCKLLETKLPIIQAGMVWTSGASLAAASANAGILGVIGAGSMPPSLLKQQIEKAKSLTKNNLAVNVPLLYSKCEEQIKVALDAGIKTFITSAGSPKKFTHFLKRSKATVIHVVSNPYLAKKCEEEGVDIIIAEGFEAGGHNGRDEITSLCLIPQVLEAVKIPVVAAGGIASGKQIAAMLCLGASGVQIGTLFVATKESSVHQNYKELLVQSKFDSTQLALKKLIPVRLFKNKFFEDSKKLEDTGASIEDLKTLLGKGRAKLGMLDGDLENGELEIGQICALIKDIPSVRECVERLKKEYDEALNYVMPKTMNQQKQGNLL